MTLRRQHWGRELSASLGWGEGGVRAGCCHLYSVPHPWARPGQGLPVSLSPFLLRRWLGKKGEPLHKLCSGEIET